MAVTASADAAGPTVNVSLDALEELNRLRLAARVAAAAVHDVNNSLQIVSGQVELLQARGALPEGIAERIAKIGAHAARAAQALSTLSSYTRDDPAVSRIVDVSEVVAAALALRDFSLKRAKIAVSVDRTGAGPYHAAADRRAMLQVILNILTNAEQALRPKGGGSVAVTIAREGSRVVLSVADDGPGFPAEARSALADDAWRRIDSSAAHLGLMVAARIAARHGQQLELVALPRGACVRLSMPVAGGGPQAAG